MVVNGPSGHAVTEIVVARQNPSGRLPVSCLTTSVHGLAAGLQAAVGVELAGRTFGR